MTISKHEVAAVVDVGDGITLDVIAARVTLDDGWTPYIQAELTCWTPPEEDLELLDPREQLRVTLTLTKAQAAYNPGQLVDQERELDLLLRGRQVDHETGTMTVTVESDEALLQDLALVATESEQVYGTSVKTAVAHVLERIGAELEATTVDGSVESNGTVLLHTNLHTNPSAESSLSGYSTANGATTTRGSSYAIVGSQGIRVSCPANGIADSGVNLGVPAPTAGKTYTFSVFVRAGSAGSYRISAQGSSWSSSNQALYLEAGEVGRLSVTRTAATSGSANVYVLRPSALKSSVVDFDIDGVMVTETAEAIDYFDGSTADTDDYTYAWTGTEYESASTQTVATSEALVWTPGSTAWDYLEPLLQTTGLRLYCDENRAWILEPSGTARDGQINIAAGSNVTRGRDQISRQELWYDSVVIAYTRTPDGAGGVTTAYDIAGAPGSKTLVLSYDRPYPGPGAAQAVLDRAQGRGRVLELEAIADYTATPGMTLSASLPASPIQTGAISSVEWRLPEARMTIGSRGLTDTPEAAWQLAAEDLAWEDIASGVDWTEYVPS